MRVLETGHLATRQMMAGITEDTELIRQTLGYGIELYRELTDENGAPTLGIQNQIVDFILRDPDLGEPVAQWSLTGEIDEATTRPARRLPYDAAYSRIRDLALSVIDKPVFARPAQEPPDRR